MKKSEKIAVKFTAEPPPAECVAVAIRPGSSLERTAAQINGDGEKIAKLLAVNPLFKGAEGDILPVPTDNGWLVLVGLGEAEKQSVAGLRRTGGALFAGMSRCGPSSMTLRLDLSPVESAELGYGFLLRSWQPANIYRQKHAPEKENILTSLIIETTSPTSAAKHFERLAKLAESVAFTRDLVMAPANYLTPQSFEEQINQLKDLGIGIETVNPDKAGLRLLDAVGKGSAVPPRLILLHWQGTSANEKPAVFVGKGITFDTGGISIKPGQDMGEMKGDMAGAAAIAGLLRALAARRAALNATGVLAIAENMVAGRATRPGDVVYGYNNLSVEIIDTDAEGRLILADALAWAAKKLDPAFIVDLATLTGAVEIALGHHRAGLFANDDRLAAELMEAGDAEDEKLWQLPLTDLYDDALKSDIADLRNCQWKRGPDALHAARFLEHFIPAGLPWAHIDIAGTSEAEEDSPLAAKGPTGFGVRLLSHLVATRLEGQA